MIPVCGMAWTTAQRDELQATIATGLLTVEYSGPPARRETYQSLDAMRALLAEMNRQLAGAPAYRLGVVRTGLNTGGGTGTSGFGSGGNP